MTKTELLATTADSAPKKRSVEHWVSAIDELIGKQKRTSFEIGDLLIKAEAELAKTHFAKVVRSSGLRSKQNAHNYMRVARAKHLRKPEIFNLLPTTVGALIDLAAWSENEITQGITAGIIHPQSERKKLKKWVNWFRFRPSQDKGLPDTAKVVGYIMCDISTYDFERIARLQEQFDKIKLQCLDDGMYITPYPEDERGIHRMEMLAERIWDAYKNDPSLFVNPAFHDLMERKQIDKAFSLRFHLPDIAPLIASADHKPLHRIIKFSKSDWRLFGVSKTGYATLLSYFA
jgi:hypothetical protein